jgi:hypothetical protein
MSANIYTFTIQGQKGCTVRQVYLEVQYKLALGWLFSMLTKQTSTTGQINSGDPNTEQVRCIQMVDFHYKRASENQTIQKPDISVQFLNGPLAYTVLYIKGQ